MAIRDFFKKKKPEETKKPVSKTLKKTEQVKAEPVKAEPVKAEPIKNKADLLKKEKKQISVESYRILKGPHVTEKAGDLSEKQKYVFKVYKQANKTEIKKAVESVYKIEVVSVRIINVFKKKRRLGKIKGFRSGYKKAIVRIKKGQKIEVLPR